MHILLLMMFSLVLAACGPDDAYEEVYGIKIGAPVSEITNISDYERAERSDEGRIDYMISPQSRSHDENLYIITVNDRVVLVNKAGYKEGLTSEKFNDFVLRMSDRWGKPCINTPPASFRGVHYIKFMPKDEVIKEIWVTYSPDYLDRYDQKGDLIQGGDISIAYSTEFTIGYSVELPVGVPQGYFERNSTGC